MQSSLVPRRTQFSSCDACRRSRVACDAMRPRGAPTSVTGQDACTRCTNRGRQCTFEWMKRATNPRSRRTLSDNRLPSSPTVASTSHEIDSDVIGEDSSTSNSLPERPEEHVLEENWHGSPISSAPASNVSAEVATWLQSMYKDGFEAVFGSWLGNYSCPYIFGKLGQKTDEPRVQGSLSLCVSISTLCSEFDHWMKSLEFQGKESVDGHPQFKAELDKERKIDCSLELAIQTYSARWLALAFQDPSLQSAQTQRFESLWRELRRDLLKVINRPCYRSTLTLFLFALTPIPAGIPEEEEGDGIPAQLCVQTALQQVQHLRARQRSLEFNGSKVSSVPDPAEIASNPDQITADFMDIESVIYWAALTFDTSSSLTLNTKSLLSSGLLGWELESSWRLVRTCTNMFHEQTEDWRAHGVDVNEENANRIIAAASAWKLLVWKVGAVFKEALREGREEDAVCHAFTRMTEAVEQFNLTYRSLMLACERHIQFLSQLTKLRWYETMLHYNLCILIVIDAIATAQRTDLLEQIRIIRSDAEGSVINCLAFGLNNQFSIPRKRGDTSEGGATVSLVAIDPYTHHVVAAVQLVWKANERNLETGKLNQNAFENIQSMLVRTLETLPQTSKSVQNAKQKAQLSSARYQQSLRQQD